MDKAAGKKCSIEEGSAITCLVKGLSKIGIYERLEQKTLTSKAGKFQDNLAWKKQKKQAQQQAKAPVAALEPTPITRAPKGKKHKLPAGSAKAEKPAAKKEPAPKSWRKQKVQPKEKFDEDFLFSKDG